MTDPCNVLTTEELVEFTLNWLNKREQTKDAECQIAIEHWNEPDDERERRLRG